MKASPTILTLTLAMLAALPAFAKGSGASHGTSSSSANATTGTGSKTAATNVHGYTKKDGTHVDAYKRTTADNTQKNNYSATGNYNPYTAKTGTTPPKK